MQTSYLQHQSLNQPHLLQDMQHTLLEWRAWEILSLTYHFQICKRKNKSRQIHNLCNEKRKGVNEFGSASDLEIILPKCLDLVLMGWSQEFSTNSSPWETPILGFKCFFQREIVFPIKQTEIVAILLTLELL